MKSADLTKLRIAIIGGGYGGASAAAALHAAGATDVTVYEQAEATAEVGAGIGLRPPSVEMFRTWGIFDAISAVSSPSDYFEILNQKGEVLAREEWPKMHDYAQVNKCLLIHRADFVDALRQVLPDGVLKLGHKAIGIEDHGEYATVTFANGVTIDADVVIGADGIRSMVRGALFSDKAPVFSGWHAYRAVISADDAYGLCVDDNVHLWTGENGTMVYFLPLRHRNQVSYDVTAPSQDDAIIPEITKEYLNSLMDGFDERMQHITADLDMAGIVPRSGYDIDPIPVWHSDCVALLGDAAHSMLWHQGQGANSAILDAAGLADALAKADTVAAGLARYQEIRKPMTDELQRLSRQGWTDEPVETPFPEKATLKYQEA